MRTRTIAAAVATAALLLGSTGCSSYSVEDCRGALTDESTKTKRPQVCQDLSQKDYDTVLMHWTLKKTFNDMDKKDRHLLDYHDDGQINDSILDG